MIKTITQDSTNHRWRIKITQIDCSIINDLRAPTGCLQFFRERSGVIKSFNWDNGNQNQYVKNQDYSICIRKNPTDCQLTLVRSPSAPTGSTSIGPVRTINSRNCRNDNGCGENECVVRINGVVHRDLLQVVAYYKTDNGFKVGGSFCGVGLGSDSVDDGMGIIVQNRGPFVVHFTTDDNAGVVLDQDVTIKPEMGFSIDYAIQTQCQNINIMSSP